MVSVFKPFWNRRQRRPRALWRLLLHLVICAVGILFLALPLMVLAGADVDPDSRLFLIVGGIVQSLALIAGSGLAFFVIDRRRLRDLKIDSSFAREFAVGSCLGALLMVAIFAAELTGGWVRVDSVNLSLDTLLHLAIYQFGWMSLMARVALSEEFFSRGLQLKNLAEGLAPLGAVVSCTLAILLSSIFFGMLHLGNPHANLVSTSGIVMAGIFLALARLRTGRLALPIGIHFTWNYFQGPVLGFPVSGTSTPGSLLRVTDQGPDWLTGGVFGPEAGFLGLVALCVGSFILLGAPGSFGGGQVPLRACVVELIKYKPRRNKQPRDVSPPDEQPGNSLRERAAAQRPD